MRRVFVSLGLLMAGCVRTPSHTAEHWQCRSFCTSAHDRCVVGATDGLSLQRCDQELRACLPACPY